VLAWLFVCWCGYLCVGLVGSKQSVMSMRRISSSSVLLLIVCVIVLLSCLGVSSKSDSSPTASNNNRKKEAAAPADRLQGLTPESVVSFAADQILAACDKTDKQTSKPHKKGAATAAAQGIDKSELQECLSTLKQKKLTPEFMTAHEFFLQYDVNGDGSVTKREMVDILKGAMEQRLNDWVSDDEDEEDNDDDDDSTHNKKKAQTNKDGKAKTYKLTTRDGKTREVTHEQMEAMMKEQMQNQNEFGDMTADDQGRYMKETKGSKTLEKIAQEDPQLNKFIHLAKWAVNNVCLHGTLDKNNDGSIRAVNVMNASENILKVRSLPFGGSPNRGDDKIEDIILGAEFEVHCLTLCVFLFSYPTVYCSHLL
jgi:Ca2+-binding EF-hand superfamily protein